jgi:hypothetical protein
MWRRERAQRAQESFELDLESGGCVEVLLLQVGVDEEAYADAEGDEAAGGTAEDVALAEHPREDAEEGCDADGTADQDDASEADVSVAAIAVGHRSRPGNLKLFASGWRNEAFGDGCEALLAFKLALAGSGGVARNHDAGDHGAAGDGNDEGAVRDLASGGHADDCGEGF